ncbi:hypothetical protein L596_001829 [Steinernema carpocapsae]|uniref:Uncharacterized protein n=1 Tax=Steinernema carpocapsae TaxID=34508 RepID=A0A4U8UM95_STECR|nr:hypothetical protein L596_001829 [Steinernema carpocapsae]
MDRLPAEFRDDLISQLSSSSVQQIIQLGNPYPSSGQKALDNRFSWSFSGSLLTKTDFYINFSKCDGTSRKITFAGFEKLDWRYAHFIVEEWSMDEIPPELLRIVQATEHLVRKLSVFVHSDRFYNVFSTWRVTSLTFVIDTTSPKTENFLQQMLSNGFIQELRFYNEDEDKPPYTDLMFQFLLQPQFQKMEVDRLEGDFLDTLIDLWINNAHLMMGKTMHFHISYFHTEEECVTFFRKFRPTSFMCASGSETVQKRQRTGAYVTLYDFCGVVTHADQESKLKVEWCRERDYSYFFSPDYLKITRICFL